MGFGGAGRGVGTRAGRGLLFGSECRAAIYHGQRLGSGRA